MTVYPAENEIKMDANEQDQDHIWTTVHGQISPTELQIQKDYSAVGRRVSFDNYLNDSETNSANGDQYIDYDKRKSTISNKSLISTASSMFHSGFNYHHVIVFLLTYISYMQFHAMRKTFSTVKSPMVDAWVPESTNTSMNSSTNQTSHQLFSTVDEAEEFLGILDCVFMFCYAAGLYICGILGDRFDPRLVLSIGMCSTAIINVLFGCVTEWTKFYSIPLYVILWILNGFLQATGWPTVVCVMGNWFGREGRGLIFGFWSSCQSLGNIVGTYLAMAVLGYGYEYAFLINASLLFIFGIVVFFFLVPAPRDIGLSRPSEQKGQSSASVCDGIDSNERPKPISFFKAVLLPGVIAYSLAYACLKLVNYSIFFWLPYYLQNNFGWPDTVAASVSSYYDWGGIIGGTVAGIVSDWLGKRTPVVSTQLIFSIIAFGFYTLSPNNEVINGVLMGIVGFFVSGSANLVSAAVSADLGRQDAVKNSAEALATVSGIVDGTGSVGAAFGQLMIPLFEQWFGWNSIFYMFMVMLFIAFLLLSKLCWREIKQLYQKRKRVFQLSSSMGEQSMTSERLDFNNEQTKDTV